MFSTEVRNFRVPMERKGLGVSNILKMERIKSIIGHTI